MFKNSAGLQWRARGDGRCSVFRGGRTAFLCLVRHKDAGDGLLRQNMMPRRLRAHPERQREKKGSSHSGRGRGEEGDYASIGLHWIRQSPNSSGFSLRCNRVNGLEISEAARGHLHLKRIFPRYHIAYVQDGHAYITPIGWKETRAVTN